MNRDIGDIKSKDKQLEKLSKNYDDLEEEKKDTLLVIGEKLLSIQDLVNDEKLSEGKTEKVEILR